VPAACVIDDLGSWTQYFEGLLNNGASSDEHPAMHEFLNIITCGVAAAGTTAAWRDCAVVLQRRVAASALADPFTLVEIERGLKRMKNNKSGGVDPVTAECYKYALCLDDDGKAMRNVMAPVLLTLLEHIRSSGDYPSQFQVTTVAPIYKGKGDVSAHGNYRGLAVGGALAKLYAALLERRLSDWAETEKLRAATQAGFRRKRGTAENLFIMRYLTEYHQLPNTGGLYVCQIDFEKAFDKVPRHALWARLEERGVPIGMLAALQASYEHVHMRVKINGKLGAPFMSKQGVKQGDPTSTILFGLFIEVLAQSIDALLEGQTGDIAAEWMRWPMIEGRRVPHLLYADDINLIARNPRQLQWLLETTRLFCDAFGMKVNVSKSEVLAFHALKPVRERMEQQPFTFGTVPLRVVQRARYLGLHYGPGAPFAGCTAELLAAGQRAQHALRAKLEAHSLLMPAIQTECFNVQVRSVLSYGAEVWGPDKLPRSAQEACMDWCLRDDMVGVQQEFLKRVAGAGRPTSMLLYTELAQLPLQSHWLRLVLSFWNALVRSDDDALRRTVLRAYIRMACVHKVGWVHGVFEVLDALGFERLRSSITEEMIEHYVSLQLPVRALLADFQFLLMQPWLSPRLCCAPRDFVSDGVQPGVKLCRYMHWMGLCCDVEDPLLAPSHARTHIPRAWHVVLMRLRLGVWPLEVNRPRGRARNLRLCCHCDAGAVEDEQHVVLECAAYADLRGAFALDYSSMLDLMCSDARLLAEYVARVHARRFAPEAY
jgi:hypothetical protein